ncbi:APC family permease [Tenggerimyces flavus]|uniref:APC family permease n=1 Tax=Tenggerimyces flavus TaxID=1708749 RepID=A0ABV7YMY6_9ACTN|nr:APC family permease [Tenggerimyces flavus]MBM7787716.1 amino acid transporter [Tenggerimyces flavus]
MKLADLGKRLLVGRKLRSTQLHETLLPKRVALPVFASDALSSVAYAPDEIFITLSFAGMAAYAFSWKIGIAVGFVMLVVVASYRQNVQAYQSGGGDYEVATVNLGKSAGLTVASALLVDYVLTVAVSISSAAQYVATAIGPLRGHETTIAVVATLLVMTVNLRGIKESGVAFAVPTYLFMFAILGMAAWGFIRYFFGDLPAAETAELQVAPEAQYEQGFTGLLAGFLILRTFASGCAALTGVEAISNGVPAFRKPKGKNAATTLLLLGTIAVAMGLAINVLGNIMGVRMAEDPATQLIRPDGTPVGEEYHQAPVISQLSQGIFDHFPIGFFIVAAVTGLILVLAANTAFNGFPVLGSILARDGYLPRQLHTRGDRLAFSNGIFLLAGFAILLIVAFNAEVTRLIQLYIVGVFVSFTISQTGMIRHWTRLLRTEQDGAKRRHMQRSRIINSVGLATTSTVLIVVLITKFIHGAWIAIAAMVGLFLLMRGIRRHYDRVAAEIAVEEGEEFTLPSRVHSVVLVSKLHRPALRALAFARAARPNVLEAVTVDVEPEETRRLVDEWDRRGVPVPLKVLASPYREISRPILEYVRSIRRGSPRDVVMVYIPEYVVGRWWEQVLHNQSALRLKGRLLFTPNVMVTSVPYQLQSSEIAKRRQERDNGDRRLANRPVAKLRGPRK